MAGPIDSPCSVNTTHPLAKTSESRPTTDCTSKDWEIGQPVSGHTLPEEDIFNLDPIIQLGNDRMPTPLNEDNLIPSNVTTSNVGSNSNPPQPPRSVNEKISQEALAKEVKISTHL